MPATRLVCIDFDKTAVKGHFHATLSKEGTAANSRENGVQVLQGNGVFKNIETGKSIPKNKGASRERIQALLNSGLGPKNPNEMADTIRLAINNGHAVAFTSFTLYPEVIRPTLEFIGLEDSYIEQIAIIGGFPSHGKADNSPDGKEEHIKAALEEFRSRGMPLSRSDVMLVDDSRHNIDIANHYSQTNVLVPAARNADPSYFEPIRAFIGKPVSKIASNPDPNLEESENNKYPLSQLNALSTAEIKKFPNREGTYLKFPNDKERQEACALLADTFGEDAFRVSRMQNVIEVNDERIIDLLRRCEGEQNKVAILEQELEALEKASHLQSLLDEPIKDEPVPEIVSQSQPEKSRSLTAYIKSEVDEYKQSEMDRYLQSLDIQRQYQAHRGNESMPKAFLKKGKELLFSRNPRDTQISSLQVGILSIKNDERLTHTEKAERLYRLVSKVESDVGKEHNMFNSALDRVVKEIKTELASRYPELQAQEKAEMRPRGKR